MNNATYTHNEIISATHAVRNFGGVLDSLEDNEIQKIGILRKSKLEAVLISAEKYDQLCAFEQILEESEWYQEIKERLQTPRDKYIDFDSVIKKSHTHASV